MNYETLTVEQTGIWIGNIEKTISLLEALTKIFVDRSKLMDEQYTARYQTGWRKFFYEADYWISAGGNAYPIGSLFKASKVEPFSAQENTLRYFVNDYTYNHRTEYKDVSERWAKYAKRPFEVHESDIIFYQKMKRYHAKAVKMAKLIGMEYEAFNLDEDS